MDGWIRLMAELPPDWEAVDTGGEVYYYNNRTNDIKWERNEIPGLEAKEGGPESVDHGPSLDMFGGGVDREILVLGRVRRTRAP